MITSSTFLYVHFIRVGQEYALITNVWYNDTQACGRKGKICKVYLGVQDISNVYEYIISVMYFMNNMLSIQGYSLPCDDTLNSSNDLRKILSTTIIV